ncbi:NfeD family protein [Uliginosibacterium sp. 31-12]|uniref:NfeD family protein n=1 Tax=Uliginosibacterium sp. 31-12 TaxID=3062781 RepID=UPI0026E19B3D|nr:NfeD family protein [Uliginosibacterium sp. 31-12]MDO6385263.1 NfeD family protein [Uliginosibacterium sp. 31-12]
MSILWWHWIVIGFALCVAELALPALVLIWLGVAALALGLLVLLIPMQMTLQLLLWAVLSTALTFGWLRFFRRRPDDLRVGSSSEALGEIGLLVKAVEPYVPGEVLFQRPVLGSDRWACIAEAKLSAGSRVRVLAVEGSCVRVEAA